MASLSSVSHMQGAGRILADWKIASPFNSFPSKEFDHWPADNLGDSVRSDIPSVCRDRWFLLLLATETSTDRADSCVPFYMLRRNVFWPIALFWFPSID